MEHSLTISVAYSDKHLHLLLAPTGANCDFDPSCPYNGTQVDKAASVWNFSNFWEDGNDSCQITHSF
jgi:hypothetical protein